MEKVKVMVVDDSKISRMMISSMLAKTNFEVCAVAENGAEAIDLYAKNKPDVVTMDMNLPDSDGIEVSRRIHAMDPHCKIVMISAMKDAKLIMQGRLAGISSFLQKPINANELMETLLLLCQDDIGAMAVYRDIYVQTFSKALHDELAEMLGLRSDIEIHQDEKSQLNINGVVVIIGITGAPKGRVAFHMSHDTMMKFAKMQLQLAGIDYDATQEEAEASIEETANIISGRAVSKINDIYKEREMRLTPPGTISGADIHLVNPELVSFNIVAKTKIGDICMSIGFSRGV